MARKLLTKTINTMTNQYTWRQENQMLEDSFARALLIEHNIKEVTTQRQAKNGTREFELDAESKEVRKMQVLGQISQRQDDGSGAVHWIVGENVCGEDNSLERDESHVSRAVEQDVHCIPQASQLWRKKFMYRNLTKSLHEYGDWHQQKCGQSPAKKLGGVHLLLSPARRPTLSSEQRSLEACARDEAKEWLKDHPSPSAATEAMRWLQSQPSPAAALQAVQCLLQTRGYRAFKHWMALSLWCQSSKLRSHECMLLCGDAEWDVVVRRSRVDNRSCWRRDGALDFVSSDRLQLYTTEDNAKIGTAPVTEDYILRDLPIPGRLASDISIKTPDNLKINEEDAEMLKLSRQRQTGEVTGWIEEYGKTSPVISVPEVAAGRHSTRSTGHVQLVYLADDHHWRRGDYVKTSEENHLIVAFANGKHRVSLSRCVFSDQEGYAGKADQLAKVRDYVSRGMPLSYGFHLELALFKWKRRQAQRLAVRAIQRWEREFNRDKAKRQENLVEKSYLPSTLVEKIPDYPKIHNNVMAADLMGQPKLEVEQFVQTKHAGAYVCLRGIHRFIVNQGKVPSSLKTRINDYRVWHVKWLGCVPEDLVSSRHSEMPDKADGPVTRAHSNRRSSQEAKPETAMGDEFPEERHLDVSEDGTETDEIGRQPAHFSKHRCDFEKLSSLDNHLLEDTVVVLLTETKLRGRTAGYAEYQFRLPDGSRRRLSAREKMSNKVKSLVEEYEEWHVLQVGMRGLPWIKDQSMLDDSEEESEEEPLPFEVNSGDGSEPEDLDNMETCKQVAEKDLAERGLHDYSVVRHIDTWSSDTLRRFAQFGNVAILPQVCEVIKELAGKPVLVYEMAADKKETVTMSEQDLLEAWFALDATVIGEAADSSLLKPAVMVQTAAGTGQPKSMAISMPVTSLFRSLEAAVQQMKCMELGRSGGRHNVMPVVVLVATASMCEKYAGLNIKNVTYLEWLGVKKSLQAEWEESSRSPEQAHFCFQGVSEDGFAHSLKQMNDNKGRDFFEEAEMAELQRQADEKRVLEDHVAMKTQATQLFGVDQRPMLSSQDKSLNRSRCPRFSCEGIMEKFDLDCCTCECPRLDLCVCEGCGQAYNPNRHKKCGTQGCDRLFPHHPQFYRQKKEARDEMAADKDAEKLTAEKMKRKVDGIRWRKVLQDQRGEASIRMINEPNPVEVVDILGRLSTAASQDLTFNRSPIEDYTACISYDMAIKSSKALCGSVAKGRLSIWQFLPMTGAWKSTWYYSVHILSDKKMMTAAQQKALGGAPAEIKTFTV